MERPTKDLAAYDLYLRAKQLIYDTRLQQLAGEKIILKRCSYLTKR